MVAEIRTRGSSFAFPFGLVVIGVSLRVEESIIARAFIDGEEKVVRRMRSRWMVNKYILCSGALPLAGNAKAHGCFVCDGLVSVLGR